MTIKKNANNSAENQEFTSEISEVTVDRLQGVPENMKPVVEMMYNQIDVIKATQGDKLQKLETIEQELADIEQQKRDLEEQRKTVNQEALELRPIVRDAQIQIKQLEDSIQRMKTPTTLISRGRPSGARSGMKKEEILDMLPAQFTPNDVADIAGITRGAAGSMLYRLAQEGAIVAVERGVYTRV